MMQLKDECRELEHILTQAEAECQAIIIGLNEFENYTGSYVTSRLLRRLAILAQWIASETQRLYMEHQGEGYVCVFLSQREGTAAYWVEDEGIVADKSRFTPFGSTVTSPEVVTEAVRQLIEHLQSNDWPRVVDWLNRYGKSPGLDLNQRLEDG